jgi:hypothetical protein
VNLLDKNLLNDFVKNGRLPIYRPFPKESAIPDFKIKARKKKLEPITPEAENLHNEEFDPEAERQRANALRRQRYREKQLEDYRGYLNVIGSVISSKLKPEPKLSRVQRFKRNLKGRLRS